VNKSDFVHDFKVFDAVPSWMPCTSSRPVLPSPARREFLGQQLHEILNRHVADVIGQRQLIGDQCQAANFSKGWMAG
jgi:hypothetical protein